MRKDNFSSSPAGKTNHVLLVFCAPTKREYYINSLPPLGILYLASYLESRGIRTDVVDCQVDKLSRYDLGVYEVIGFSVNIANVERSLAWMRKIKQDHPLTRIVVGGPHCMSVPEFFLGMDFIDAVCTGEGEEALYEYIVSGGSVPGMYARAGGGGFIYPGSRSFLENLDELPFPALNKVDISKYAYFPKRKSPVSSIMTSRGCPYSCIFCFQSMGRKWRQRSPSSVVEEIEWQTKTLGVKEIAIYDDNFSLDRSRVIQICAMLAERDVNVMLQFTNGLRVENLDEEVLVALKRAGTWLIGVAPDTGSDRVMELIEKKIDLVRLKRVVQICKKLGIRTFAFFMIGFPGESDDEIESTISYAKELDTDMVQFARVLAYRGTRLFEMLGIRNRDHGREMGYFYETEDNKSISIQIRRAYRAFYLRPRKVMGLFRIHSLKDVVSLARYSFVTKSI